MPQDPHPLETAPSPGLPFEPAPLFRATPLQDDAALAPARGKRIGILIVTYNAVNTLLPVLKRITPNVWNNVEEVLVFDDASPDATYELAVGIKALRNIPKLTVLRHERNLGYGGNQKAGYAYFMSKGFDIVVLLHGDGQYAPEILAHLYAPLVAGEADAVFGSRMSRAYGGPLKGGMPLYKYVGNRILTAFENASLRMRLSEFHSGYRAYSLAALRKICFDRMTDDFHFDTEIIIKLNHQGFRIREVPIPTYYGKELCYVNGLRYARDAARAVLRYRLTVSSVRNYPEFSEYWVHYPLKLGLFSSHYYVTRFVQPGQSVLDVGCGHGFIAERLHRLGCEVTGVDAIDAPERRDSMAHYHQCDLMAGLGPVLPALAARRFDRILLLDVLEHLPDPERILRQVQPLLAPEGRILVSLPNVANITVRLMLLFGKWDYADRGIMDRTHLRFFTRRTARRLLEDSGYEVLEQKTTVMPLELVLGLPPLSRLMRLISTTLRLFTTLFPGLLAYQILYLARTPLPETRRKNLPSNSE
jgi:glycosyltransferase involved in cell wall biosynthesis